MQPTSDKVGHGDHLIDVTFYCRDRKHNAVHKVVFTINGVRQETQEELFSIEKSFLDLALARISAEINDAGVGSVHLVSEKLGIDVRATSEDVYLATGALRVDARYFIYSREVLSGVSLDVASRMGREFGGVRVYRNGFRVLPYGEPKDDWLGFDADTARRNILLPASNRAFFGEIRLGAIENPLFEETSSREGLLENEGTDRRRCARRLASEERKEHGRICSREEGGGSAPRTVVEGCGEQRR